MRTTFYQADKLLSECFNTRYSHETPPLRKLAEVVSRYKPYIAHQYADKVEGYGLSDADEFMETVKSFQKKADTLREKQSKPTDDELAQRWLDKYPHTKYGLGEFRRYEDGIYPAIDIHIIDSEIGNILIEAKSEGIRPTHTRVKSVCELAKAMAYKPDEAWDSDADYLPFKNGLLNLDTLSLDAHTPDLLFTSGLDYKYDSQADCPVFKYVLSTTIPEAEPFLQEFAGYCLTTDTKFELAVWLYGPPGGGKSTILTGFRTMLGPRSGLLGLSDIERSQFALAKLPGKTLMVSYDQPGNKLIVTNTLNSIISGEPINVDRKFREIVEIRPRAKILWALNELPRLKSANNGLLRRVKVIQVPALQEDSKDVTLKEKVEQESPGILNWALDGLGRLRHRGYFDPPMEVLDATNNFKATVDIPMLFVNERCERGSESSEQSSELYGAYKYWCENNGYDCLSTTAIAEEWKRIGFEKYTAAGRHRWKGVKLIER